MTLDSLCVEFTSSFADIVLEGDCAQETWVDRVWTVVACEDTLIHTQIIRLRDTSSPFVLNPFINGGHFCDTSLDWLPVIQDNCDASLTGGFSTRDSVLLCQGVLSFDVVLDIADDCGNHLDTNYTVYLHDLDAPSFSNVPADAVVECGEDANLEDATFENCGGLTFASSDVTTFPFCSGSRWFGWNHGCLCAHSSRPVRNKADRPPRIATPGPSNARLIALPQSARPWSRIGQRGAGYPLSLGS